MSILHQIVEFLLTSRRPLNAKSKFSELKLGVWRLIIADDSGFKLPGVQSKGEVMTVLLPLFRRAFGDMYTVYPSLFYLIIVTHLWRATEESMSLYFSNRLMFLVS
ncbi:hypothetical protein ID866_7068 [Astraeus odoratus]|nr:hypothetical protein ID866_7068 [Astraeus odoratus]